MPSFDIMYYHLFHAATDAARELEKGNTAEAMEILEEAQIHTEEMYMDEKEEPAD